MQRRNGGLVIYGHLRHMMTCDLLCQKPHMRASGGQTGDGEPLGCRLMTSRPCVPIEPVDPRMTTVFLCWLIAMLLYVFCGVYVFGRADEMVSRCPCRNR